MAVAKGKVGRPRKQRLAVRRKKPVPAHSEDQGEKTWDDATTELLASAMMRPFINAMGGEAPRVRLYAVAGSLCKEVEGKLLTSLIVGIVPASSPDSARGQLQRSVQNDERGFLLRAACVTEIEEELMQRAVLGVPAPLQEGSHGVVDPAA